MLHSNQKQIVLRVLACLLALLMLLSGCKKKDGDGTETGSDTGAAAPVVPSDAWVLSQNKQTEYTIYVRHSDEAAKAYAKELQVKLFSMSGVTVPFRDADSDAPSGKCILVGLTGHEAADSAVALLGQKDFVCRTLEDGSLVLAATSREMYLKLGLMLFEQFISSDENRNVFLSKSGDVLLSRDYPSGSFGTEAPILQNGGSAYVIVHNAENGIARSVVNKIAGYIELRTGVRLTVKTDRTENAKEIWVGKVNRGGADEIAGMLKSSGDYAIAVRGDDLMICGQDEIGLVYAAERLVGMMLASQGNLTLHTSDVMISTYESEPYAFDTPACVSLYQDIYETYSTYVELWRDLMSQSDKDDQSLIEALMSRMGESAAFKIGSSTAIQNGFFVKLDAGDYEKTARLEGDALLIPAAFAQRLFGDGVAVTDGYCNVSALCAENSAFTLTLDADGCCAVLTGSGVASFADAQASSGGYTNAQYLSKLHAIFHDPLRRDPGNDTEQSRVVVTEMDYTSEGVWDYTKYTYRTTYSPGICATVEDGREVLYVSYEECLVQNFNIEKENTTYLRRSTDGGATWTAIGEPVPGMRWACIFEIEGKVYLLGTHVSNKQAMVAKYDPADNSFMWKSLGVSGGVGAPCSVLIKNGRIYKANGDNIMSAATDSDLLKGESWSFSNRASAEVENGGLGLTRDWFTAEAAKYGAVKNFDLYALGEGSVVEGPDGGIYMFLRIDCDPNHSFAAIVAVSEDGKTLSKVEACNSLLRLPTTISKFSVRYDRESGLYLTMTSIPTLEDNGAAKQRNTLALLASRDMINWTVVDTLLVDREIMNNTLSARAHGFQYVDFVVSGDNLRMIVREAVGETNSYHDGKYVTFYTVKSFRELVARNCPELAEP